VNLGVRPDWAASFSTQTCRAGLIPSSLDLVSFLEEKEVTMIELTDEQAGVLKQGYPVRVFVPELGGDIVVIRAAQRESMESVLQETLDEIRERSALSQLGRQAAVSWMKENPYG
jgi:hypothetical protein